MDDGETVADLASQFLDGATGHIESVSETSVSGAPERLADEAETFDCIVSDYDLSDQPGIGILRRVRETNATFPLILFTGKETEPVANEAITAGVSDHIQKRGGAPHRMRCWQTESPTPSVSTAPNPGWLDTICSNGGARNRILDSWK